MENPAERSKMRIKDPSEIQLTAEQFICEAKEQNLELLPPPLKQKILDPQELAECQQRHRQEFEDKVKTNRMSISHWLKYAEWEENQDQIDRARSIYERALEVDYQAVKLWLSYVEMEMKNRQINHARSLWDRAVTKLPHVNQFWYKFTYMEEMLENIAGARQIFERWMEWKPEEQAWLTYINFELRYKEIDRARYIYERLVGVHPTVENWIRYAKFESTNGLIKSARSVYEQAVKFYGDEKIDEKLNLAFAQFEESQQEYERARAIYRYAIDNFSQERIHEIYKAYVIFEKKHGEKSDIEDLVVDKKKHEYEQQVNEDPYNYDVWFEYIKLMEIDNNHDQIRGIYERAIAYVPQKMEKDFWRRYIYLWINYALFEELITEDIKRCRQIYKICLKLIPHKTFTFAKIWLLYAKFEIRQKDLAAARRILGRSLGICPKNKLFRSYIDLEIQLGEFDRCRTLYEKFLMHDPENCTTWIKYAELELLLGDVDRARAIYEFGSTQPLLDMPELLWKSYIDFEIGQGESENARQLFECLLQYSIHVKVWVAYAKFELLNSNSEGIDNVIVARRVFERGNTALRANGYQENRALLLEAWRDFENENGDDESREKIKEIVPRRIKKLQRIIKEDGTDGWTEIFGFEFPGDEPQQPNPQLLAAKGWSRKRTASQLNESSEAI